MATEAEALKVERLLSGMRESARPHAIAKSERVYLEQYRKSKKAILMIEAEQKGIKTVSERECYAYAHEDYIQLLVALSAATEKEELHKTIIEGCRLSVALYQTTQANERAERKAYGA